GRTGVVFSDQPPVRAALEGGVLVLDGIDRAERNVLPLLNNLLENREINLESGSLIVSHERYKDLKREHADRSNIIPAHEDFRVVGLGLPVGPWKGEKLDPPLRSRFQCLRVDPPSPTSIYSSLPPSKTSKSLTSLTSALLASSSSPSHAGHHPTFPVLTLPATAAWGSTFPEESTRKILETSYPHATTTMPKTAMTDGMKQSKKSGNTVTTGPVPKGPNAPSANDGPDFVLSPTFSSALTQMLQSHVAGADVLLLSSKGGGKSSLSRSFCSRLGYSPLLFTLYKDLSSRDLLQRRSTSPTGSTTWSPSPLVSAALKGEVCVLDGVDKLGPGALKTLQQLCVERECQLPDGTRMVRHDRHKELGEGAKGVMRIHPAFRVMALGTVEEGKKTNLLDDDIGAMFRTVHLPDPEPGELADILAARFPSLSSGVIDRITVLHNDLTASRAEDCGVSRLSLRNMVRVAAEVSGMGGGSSHLAAAISGVLMKGLLPPFQQEVLDEILGNAAIKTAGGARVDGEMDALVAELKMPTPANPELVPSPAFFHIPMHDEIITGLLRSFQSGSKATLLIGNQGVGKNKLCDRVLQILNMEREYIQLHRDSTVSSLTLTPTITDGKVVWEDSPLVRAVIHGRALMVDEGDKAQEEVVGVLKSLVEDREMRLSDGRRIVDPLKADPKDPNDIPIHPSFRLIVLANRPGFPFLGNDFFRVVGDCFNSHVIPNPDLSSEVMLLESYAPGADPLVIRKLAGAFGELRDLADKGDITYPYSTREAVATVRHIEAFPGDGMVRALGNVLDFDTFDEQGSWNGAGGGYYSKAEKVVVGKDENKESTIHVLNVGPVCLNSFSGVIEGERTKSTLDIEDNLPYFLPSSGAAIEAVGKEVLIYFPAGDCTMLVNPDTGACKYIPIPGASEVGVVNRAKGFFGGGKKKGRRESGKGSIIRGEDGDGVLLYQEGGDSICLFEDFARGDGTARWVDLGDDAVIDSVTVGNWASGEWYVHDKSGGTAKVDFDSASGSYRVSRSKAKCPVDGMQVVSASIPPEHLKEDPTCRGLVGDNVSYATTVGKVGDGTFYVSEREEGDESKVKVGLGWEGEGGWATVRDKGEEDALEVVNVAESERREVGLGGKVMDAARVGPDHVVTLKTDGTVELWEFGEESLDRELKSFREMLGLGDVAKDGEGVKALTLEYENLRDGSEGQSWNPPKLEAPKEGQWDDKNEAHVGGSNWAGGTGGSNTAGLGGRGGPWRLDRGHKVHQVSDEMKEQVSEESKELAREMAQKALEDKLKSIDMGEEEYHTYEGLVMPIKGDIGNLRNGLMAVEGKRKERGWLKNQKVGELDDSKLVDGVAGERFVFKRRGVPEGEGGNPIKQPKKIRFVMDCSGSMYRFNGQDGRLDRSLEAAALIMESFQGMEERFDYSIVGHSGDRPVIPLVDFGDPPKSEAERMKILRTMVAHTQFTRSGDHTLEAIRQAKVDVLGDGASEEADEYVVIAVSDANLRRYGISTGQLKRIVEEKPDGAPDDTDVKTYAIFLASLGDEADMIKRDLGAGRGYVCKDTSILPKVIREILSGLRGL
ncbi:hypothetical protein TrRE_jg2991, partial [Triparma retinervis]